MRASLRNVAEQYQHRILSLEAELQERAAMGQLNPKLFKQCHARLKELKKILKSVESQQDRLSAETSTLRLLCSTTPLERKISIAFLEATIHFLEALLKDAKRVLSWTERALEQRTLPILSMMQLSSLRKIIQKCDTRTEMGQLEQKAVGDYADRLVSELNGSPPQGKAESIRALAKLFGTLETCTARVARLRRTLREKRSDLENKRAWLDNQRKKIRSTRYAFAPPTPMQTKRQIRSLMPKEIEKELSRYERSRSRRSAVEQYWSHIIDNNRAATHEGGDDSEGLL